VCNRRTWWKKFNVLLFQAFQVIRARRTKKVSGSQRKQRPALADKEKREGTGGQDLEAVSHTGTGWIRRKKELFPSALTDLQMGTRVYLRKWRKEENRSQFLSESIVSLAKKAGCSGRAMTKSAMLTKRKKASGWGKKRNHAYFVEGTRKKKLSSVIPVGKKLLKKKGDVFHRGRSSKKGARKKNQRGRGVKSNDPRLGGVDRPQASCL